MRGLLPVLFPHPNPLLRFKCSLVPEGEGEKRCALFTGWVSKASSIEIRRLLASAEAALADAKRLQNNAATGWGRGRPIP